MFSLTLLTALFFCSNTCALGESSSEAVLIPHYVYNTTTHTSIKKGSIELKCVVENIGDYKISWKRERDHQMLSVGDNVITPDDRISVFNSLRNDAGENILRIRSLKESDSGNYTCMINTDRPQKLTFTLYINDKEGMDAHYYFNTESTVAHSSSGLKVNKQRFHSAAARDAVKMTINILQSLLHNEDQ